MPNEKEPGNETPKANIIQSAIAAGMIMTDVKTIEPDGTIPVFILPEKSRIEVPCMDDVEQWLEQPLRKAGRFGFADVDSFCRYFNEHKTDSSRIFASVGDEGAMFNGTLNFHGQTPSFNDHTCSLSTRATHEWDVWVNHKGVHMNQSEFATFLEENADMFVEPTGAALLELVQTLEGKSHVDFTQGIKMQNKAVQLTYTETVELKGGSSSKDGQMLIPQILTVGIAPFEGTARYQMKARLRYQIKDRKLNFWYDPVDAHLVVREVVSKMLVEIERQTGTIPFRT